MINDNKICLWNTKMFPGEGKSHKSIFFFFVWVGSPCHKEPTCQIWRLYLKRLKVMTNVIFFFNVSHRWRSKSQFKIFCVSGKPLSHRNLHAKYEGSIWKGSNLMTNVKVVQQTNKPTNRQGKKQFVPAIATWDIKSIYSLIYSKKHMMWIFVRITSPRRF